MKADARFYLKLVLLVGLMAAVLCYYFGQVAGSTLLWVVFYTSVLGMGFFLFLPRLFDICLG